MKYSSYMALSGLILFAPHLGQDLAVIAGTGCFILAIVDEWRRE